MYLLLFVLNVCDAISYYCGLWELFIKAVDKVIFFCLNLSLWLFVIDLEWKIIYVGSAESEEYDQTLDSVLVGPVPAGRHMFVFQVSWRQWLR